MSLLFSRMLSRTSKSKWYLKSFYLNTLLNQSRIQIKQFVIGLFAYNDDFNKFKTHLRDFLISLKEFAGDNTELYAEEREQALREAKAAERDRAMRVGGLLKPAEMDQDDDLWLEKELRAEFRVSKPSEETDPPTTSKLSGNPDLLDGWAFYALWNRCRFLFCVTQFVLDASQKHLSATFWSATKWPRSPTKISSILD